MRLLLDGVILLRYRGIVSMSRVQLELESKAYLRIHTFKEVL